MLVMAASADALNFFTQLPELDKIKKKCVLVMKARNDKNAPDVNEHNIGKEVVMMEVNRQILESLYCLC